MNIDILKEMFLSIDKIIYKTDDNSRILYLFLNNLYSEYETTIQDIEKVLPSDFKDGLLIAFIRE